MTSDCISVIVPVYNIEKYIERCLDSIVNQTYQNLDIIVIDDGSSDRSGVICDEYAARDSRITVIHKKNAGLGYARNTGLDIASGKYVVFVDGDDYIGKRHIEKLKTLIDQTKTDTCIGGHTKVYATNIVHHINNCAGKVYIENIKEEILPRMCGANSCGEDYIEMGIWMGMLSNEIIQNNNIRFVSERDYISEDIIFNFDYYPLSKGVCISDIVDYYYCDNEGSLTTKYRADRFINEIKMYDYIIKKATELGIIEQCKERFQNTVIAITRYCIKLEYKYAKINGRKTALDRVKSICNDDTLVSIMTEYDDRKINFKSRIVNFLIKKKYYGLISTVMWMKNRFNI